MEIPKFEVTFQNQPLIANQHNKIEIKFISKIPDAAKRYIGDVLTSKFQFENLSKEDVKNIEVFLSEVLVGLVTSNQLIKEENEDEWKLNIE